MTNDMKRTKTIIFMRYPDLERKFINYVLIHHNHDHIKLRHMQKYFVRFIEDYAYKKGDRELQEFAILLRFDRKNAFIRKYLARLLIRMNKQGILVKEVSKNRKPTYRIIKRGEVHEWY